jgi:nicotinate-nucleotide pyrophosphorylase (carboxylating)
MPAPDARKLIEAALKEDLGSRGDVTTKLFVPKRARLKGVIAARAAGVICGTELAAAVFKRCDRSAKVRILVKDGRKVRPGQAVMRISGGRGLLTAERTALNFLQRLSGVATLTAEYVRRAPGKIYDTRKTLPGWRALDKYAVKCGGGINHRMGLHDAVMLKDNHWAAGGDIPRGVRALRRKHPGLPLIIEADTLDQLCRALEFGADVVLLDNMTPSQLKLGLKLVRDLRPRTKTEISGGVNLETVGRLSRLGADRISIGRLTHSAPALDLGLDLEFS